MPELVFASERGSWGTTADARYGLLKLGGFIDSGSTIKFEKALDSMAQDDNARFVVLDLSAVEYINSTGISLIIRLFGQLKARNGLLVLAGVPKSVGVSLHLLGVTSLIPFRKSVADAVPVFQGVLDGTYRYSEIAEELDEKKSLSKTKIYVPLRKSRPRLDGARIILVLPGPSRFGRVFSKRYRYLNGGFHFVSDPDEALRLADEIEPDLMVIDHRVDTSGALVQKLKLHPNRSLISLIKIYDKDRRVEEEFDFKIWENDYLVDPFDTSELFSLSEAESRRVPRDRKVFQQQVRFSFRSTRANVERASQLCDQILQAAMEGEEERTALFAGVREGIDNAVRHGNDWDAKKSIDVNFLVDRKKLTVIIEDAGNGFDFEYYLSRLDDRETFERAKRRILEEGQRGGLGILLMHRCADRIAYSGTGNILRLEKNRGS